MKPTLLTVDNLGDIQQADLVRVPATGEVFYVSGLNTRPIKAGEKHTVRVWRWRPSPLPHRLP